MPVRPLLDEQPLTLPLPQLPQRQVAPLPKDEALRDSRPQRLVWMWMPLRLLRRD